MSHLLHKRTISRLLGGGLACTLLILLFSLLLLAATPSRADNMAAPLALPMAGAPGRPVAPAMRSSLVSTTTIPAWVRELLKGNAPTSGDDLIITKSATTAESAASGGSATVVINGEYISYTLTFTNPSTTEPASDILILDILPEESLSNIGCSDDCTKVVDSQEIPDPFGNMIIVTVTRQVSWTLDTLGPGEVQTRRLWGRVIGQTDGTELRNRAFMSYVQAGTSKSTVSNDARTTVRVRIDENGQASLSDAPNWLSEDLGGTLSMDWGDYNGDGYLDLALGSTIGTSIYRNEQGRLVRAWENKRVTYGVSWGDFDGDGNLELAAVGDSLDQTWVTSGTNYIYDLTGETVEEYEFTSNEQLVRVAPGDYDNDGLLDLLVSTNSINAPCPIQMYKNSGDPAAPFGSTPICIGTEATAALGPVDYDGDGDLDLAIGVFPNQTRLLINETLAGPNPFTATTPLVLDQRGPFLPYDFAWGDYNGDGYLDLAAALPLDRRVRVYRNVGGSTLVPDAEIPTSMFRTPLAVGWGDLNGDGRIDLAVADAPPRVYEYRDGKFEELLALPADSARGQIWSLGIVDMDNEGDLDLALTNRDGPSMLFSNFAPLLAPTLSPVAATGSTAAASVAWADVDGDDDLDLLFGASQTTVGAKRYLNILGSFPSSEMASLLGSGFGPHGVAFGDVNADGQQDVALGTGTETGVQIYLNGNTETPDWTSSPPHHPSYSLAWGDVDDDGDLDLLVGRDGPNALYINEGAQLEAMPDWTSVSSFNSRSVAWGDFDNDRYLDFAIGNDGQPNQVYRNNHDNSFSLVWTSSYISNTRSVAWGDYDGDGDLDLAVGNNGQPNLIYENVAGNLAQAEAWRSSAARNTTSLAWGDWDNDGDLDLAVGNDSQPDQVYENLNSKPGVPPRFYWLWASAGSYGTSGVAWGDADGDGDLDLAVSSKTTGQSGVYHNTYVNPSHLTSAFAPTIPLPNNPSYVWVERPGSTAGAYFYSSADLLSGPKHPTVTVSYRLYDPDGTRDDSTPSNQPGDPILSTAYEFSLDGGGTWNTATPMDSQASPTATQRLGQSASFSWDAIADAAISDDARFRVCIVQQNQADPVQRGMGCAVSPPFRVRGTSCVWPRDPTIVVSDLTPDPGDTVRFQGIVAEGSGILTYTWDFGDGTSDQGQVVYHTFYNDNTYLVKLTVRSEPCPIAKEVVAVQSVVVGTGQPKIFLPIVASVTASTATSPPPATDREKAGISSPPPGQTRAGDGPSLGQTAGEAGSATFAGSPDLWPSYHPEEIQFDRQVPIAPGPGISLTVLEGSAPVFGLLPVTKDTKGINNYPSLSGDGRRLAFWSTDDLMGSGSNADGNIEIFVADIGANDRVTLTQITESTGNILGGFNLSPALSNDGTRVTFFSDCDLAPAEGGQGGNQDANFEIYYATAGDWTPEQLTETGIGANVMPSISRDGGLIAFASDRNLDPATGNDDYNQEIFVYDAGLDRFIQVSHTTGSILNNDPVISAEGHHVAFISDGELVVAELTAGGIVRTTVPNPSGGLNRQPASSADGHSIAFISGDDLWLVEFGAAGSMTMTQITDSPGALIDEPAISADGSRVAFVSNGKLFLYDKEVSLVSQVSNVSNARHPSLSADGTVLGFVSNREIFVTTSPRADLAVSKVSEPYPLVPGRGLTYTIVITNLGPSNAISTTVVDEIPVAVENPMWACTASSGSACESERGAGHLISDTVHVWAGTTITYVITGTLDASVADEVSNTVVVSVSQDLIDWRLNNNRSTDTNSASPVADLGVVKSVDDAHPNEGDQLSYTLVVSNNGPSDARGTQVTDTLPVGVAYIDSQPSQGSYNDGLWTIGILRTDMSATLTIFADVETGTGGQTIVNRAEDLFSDASDPDLSNNQASASLTVNRPPQANDDTATTLEDQAVAIDVLDNDTDLDGSLDSASLVVLTLPDNGTAVEDPITGIITYTPEPDWYGADAFEYEICDNDAACDTAVVSVTVQSVNDAPTFVAGPDQAADEDAGPQTVGNWATSISVGAPYEEGQILAFTTTNDNNALFAVQPSVDAPTGTLTYESAPDAFGQAVVTVTLYDDGGTANGGDDTSDPQTFTLTVNGVNDPPTLDPIADRSIPEDAGPQTVALSGISAGPGGESQPLDVTAVSSNPALIPDPTVAYTSPEPTGSLYFTPTANANGTTTLTVTVSDSLSDTQRAFLVTVNAINDPPVAVDDTGETLEDTPLVLDVLDNDSDADGDPLTITAVGAAARGATSTDGATVTYTPTQDLNGADNFAYTISDGILTDTASVSLTVTAVNDAPSFIVGPDQVVDEDAGPQTVIDWATAISAGPPDEIGQTLTFMVTTNNPDLFGAGPAVDAPTGTLTYESALNAFGQAVVTVTLQDNGGTASGGLDTSIPQTFTLTVNAVNDPPVAVDDTYDVDEDTVLVVSAPGVLSNDSDVDSSPLTATLSSGASHGLLNLQTDGDFVYTPTADYSGPDSFVYTASDGELSDTALVSITVHPVNDAPVAMGDMATVDEGGTVTELDSGQTSVLFNDSDPDGDNLTLDIIPVVLPGHGVVTLTVSGTFTYTHDGSETISDTFTYRVCDDGTPSACATAVVSITVNPVNDAPVAMGDTATVDEGGTVTELDSGQASLLFNDSDPEGDNLVLDTTPAVLPGHGAVTLTASGTFTYTHDGSETISDTFTYRTCDDGVPSACATAVVSITVTPVQDPPVAVDDTATTYRGGTVAELDSGAASVLDNDYDPDGDNITVRRLITDTVHGTLTWEVSGTFTYTHDGSATSSDFFVYEVCDPPPRLCSTATVTITVTPFGVRIDGPSAGTPGIGYTFTTTVLGPATTPLTYTWEATEQSPVIQAAHPALTHTVPFTWTTDGPKWITVTVSNTQGIVSETHAITIGAPGGSLAGRQFAQRIYLPLLLRLRP